MGKLTKNQKLAAETEDSSYLIHSYFNDPYSGWVHEQNGVPIEHEMETFEQYAD